MSGRYSILESRQFRCGCGCEGHPGDLVWLQDLTTSPLRTGLAMCLDCAAESGASDPPLPFVIESLSRIKHHFAHALAEALTTR